MAPSGKKATSGFPRKNDKLALKKVNGQHRKAVVGDKVPGILRKEGRKGVTLGGFKFQAFNLSAQSYAYLLITESHYGQ